MLDPVDRLFEELKENIDLELKFLVCSKSGNWSEFSFFIRKKAMSTGLSESMVKELETRLRMYFFNNYGNCKSY